jgi:hypothetical protein
MRQATRRTAVDANQREIVAALRKIGATVYIIGQPFDLLVWHCKRWSVIECKVPGGRYTAAQTRDLALLGPGAVIVEKDAMEAVKAVQYRGIK